MKPGTKVRIKGLVNAAKHNGKTGLVTKASAPGKGNRVGVKLQDGSGTVLAVKIENLDEIKPEGPSSDAPFHPRGGEESTQGRKNRVRGRSISIITKR